jgi:ABC-type sugar transport systems, ATPase components
VLELKQVSKNFGNFVVHLFRREISGFIIILGRRGTGKTDLSLLIAEILVGKGLFEQVATNIKIYDSPFPIKSIMNLEDLKYWCKNTEGRKLFIFDEIGKGMTRRRPMSSLNVKLIHQFNTLRKYKLSIVATTINEKYVDSAILGEDTLDGFFFKPNYRNPKVALYQDNLEDLDLDLYDIPKTTVKFDTWDSAPFAEHSPNTKAHFNDKDLEILWRWSNGHTIKALGLHRMKINRLCRKYIRESLDAKFHVSQD